MAIKQLLQHNQRILMTIEQLLQMDTQASANTAVAQIGVYFNQR